jgi:hypothetical protein
MPPTTFFAITPTTSPEAMSLLQTLIASGALQSVVPAPGAGPPTPTTPLATAQDVIAAIPVAEDGAVIRSNYHNSLRDALTSLLAEVAVGRGPVAPLSPAFLPIAGLTPWALGIGVASRPTGLAEADGWLPLELPHGGRMQQLVVSGSRTGAKFNFDVTLHRSPISAEAPTVEPLASCDLSTESGTFIRPEPVGAPLLSDPTPAQLLEHTLVDNTKYRYFISASLSEVPAAISNTARINSLQVVVVRV